jgi:hypothetical protein
MDNQASQNFQNNFSEGLSYSPVALGLPWRVLLFAIILFAFSIFILLGLKLGYNSYIDSKDATLDKKIDELGTKVTQDQQKSLISFYSQLNNLKDVLGMHKFSVRIFDLLEKYTLPTIYFSDAKITADIDKVQLSGVAASTENLVEQLSVFDKAPEFSDSSLQQMSFLQQGISFSIILTTKSDTLLKL